MVKPARLIGISHDPSLYVEDKENGYAFSSNSKGWLHRNFEMDNIVYTNSDGFHDIERDNKEPAYRIAAIGDSYTASIHVPVPDTWTQILEKELSNKTNLPIEVVNLGLPGSGTDMHLNILSSYQSTHDVEMVLLAFYCNDIYDISYHRLSRQVYDGYIITYQNEDQRQKTIKYIHEKKPSRIVSQLYKNIYLFRALMRYASKDELLRTNFIIPNRIGIELFLYSKKETRQRLKAAFEELLKLSHTKDVMLIVVPILDRGDANKCMTALMTNLSPELLQKLKIIDLVPTVNDLLNEHKLKYKQLFWKYDAHFNEIGNRMFAAALERVLSPTVSLHMDEVSYMEDKIFLPQ
jgi:hypothetical protein